TRSKRDWSSDVCSSDLELRLKSGEGICDRNLETFDPKIARERERVVNAATRGIRARHGNSDHVLRSEGIHCDHRDDCGIHPAAQTEHGGFEIALSQIIAQA